MSIDYSKLKVEMVVKLKNADAIKAWSGHGQIPCELYGEQDVVIKSTSSYARNRFTAHSFVDDPIRPCLGNGGHLTHWEFTSDLVDEIVTDENRIKMARIRAGFKVLGKCEVCGEEMYGRGIGTRRHLMCENCTKTHFVCSSCGQIHPKTDKVTLWTRDFCKSCFDKKIETEEIVKDNEGKYAYAVDCIKIDGQWVNLRNVEGINGYHTMKDDGKYIFFNTPEEESTSPLYLGVELEVECSDEDANLENDAKRVKLLLGKDFVQHEDDGSLDNGFENITNPATLAYHKSIMDKYNNAFSYLRANKYTSHNNDDCGLHIHFNRNFFGHKEEERVSKLLYLAEKFWKELVIFSRRSESQLNRWARRYDDAHDNVAKHCKDGYYGRYHAINLVNSKTIEFRLFRGTLNIETFFATLELVDRLVRLAKDTDIESLKTMTWEDVLNTDSLRDYYGRVVTRRAR